MFFTRRQSYISIEIESMEIIKYKKFSLEHALIIINNEQTFLQYLLVVYYNIIKKILSFIHIDLYYKRFYVNKFKLINNNDLYVSVKPVNGNQLILFDDCMCINYFKIPYEYILLSKTYSNNTVYIKIFGNIINKNNKFDIELSDGFIEILFEYTNPKIVLDCIKKNMYYHIKYNKINDDVIKYYLNFKKDTKND